MNQFDQLLKEKLNKLEYPYNSAAWYSFAKSAGLKVTTAGTKIALWSIVGCAGAGGAGYAVYHFINQNTVNKEITIDQSIISSDTVAQYADFVDSVSEAVTPQESAARYPAGSTVTATGKPQESASGVISPGNAPDTLTVKSASKTKPDSNKDVDLSKWRILTIDVDTIKSNR
jgi:hypothetical protein